MRSFLPPAVGKVLLKAAIVLVPSYTAAYLTGEMVWVVPTLVASGFLAASVGTSDGELPTRVDEDEGDGEGDDEAESEASDNS